ncbi:hypothetical protein [Tenacibaculum discolor]|uniref:hypothetical protein n=1 Tax=Tenacibaculum discolor TaxID=361581 RepID=UPI000F5A1477|nr:hypothetical protein [Tenacibaculum discolor]
MILEKVKKNISNFSDFYAKQFLPASKQYFEKEMNKAYSKITFNKDNLLFNNESKIRLNSLTIRIPLIDELLIIRKNIKSYDEFTSQSYIAFDEYCKRLKDINTHYYIDSYNGKNTTFASNVVFHKRNLFYINIHFIFFCIEKQSSIESMYTYIKSPILDTEKNKSENTKKYLNSLKENFKSIAKEFYSDSCYALIAYKLHTLNLINLKKRGTKVEIHNELLELFKKEFSYDNFCATTKELVYDIELKKEQKEFIEKLSFLDKLK